MNFFLIPSSPLSFMPSVGAGGMEQGWSGPVGEGSWEGSDEGRRGGPCSGRPECNPVDSEA